MAKFTARKAAIAIAASVMALTASMAQAAPVVFDYTFTTPNTDGYTANGNIQLTIDNTNLGNSALAPAYPFVYAILSATGTITFTGAGPTITDNISLADANTSAQVDNDIYTNVAIAPGAKFAWDNLGVGFDSGANGFFINFSGNSCNKASCTAIYLFNGADQSVSTLEPLPSTGGVYQQENIVFQTLTTVPAPLPIALIGSGLLAIGFVGQRRRRAS